MFVPIYRCETYCDFAHMERRERLWNIKHITYFWSFSMKAYQTMGAAALLALMTACGNTANGAKKDAENAADKTAEAAAVAGDKTADAASATGNAMAGAAETGQIKTLLLADTRLDAGDINVDTDEGKKTVTLKGTVPSAEHRKIAEDITKINAKGYTVVNTLTIKPK